ncbi:MAG: hypothetical protein IKO94_07570, partial [Selenomonadaceae bacterium]|nr:hypothetical protein [Selenomonadaceae bacterium]
ANFRGAIFAPNSRVCIKANNHTLKGFIIAKEFAYLNDDGEEVVITAPQNLSKELCDKLGLDYPPSFDDFGKDNKLVKLNHRPTDRVLFLNEQAKAIN